MSKRSKGTKQRGDRPEPPVDAEGPAADEATGTEEATVEVTSSEPDPAAEVLPVEVGDAVMEERATTETEHPAVAELAEAVLATLSTLGLMVTSKVTLALPSGPRMTSTPVSSRGKVVTPLPSSGMGAPSIVVESET